MLTVNFIAADLGASNGRVLLARWDGARFTLQELHRFPNGPVEATGRLFWNALGLWSDILAGLARYAAQEQIPLAGIGVDTWGVDFALLDRAGRLLGNPVHYRDARNNGMLERASLCRSTRSFNCSPCARRRTPSSTRRIRC